MRKTDPLDQNRLPFGAQRVAGMGVVQFADCPDIAGDDPIGVDMLFPADIEQMPDPFVRLGRGVENLMVRGHRPGKNSEIAQSTNVRVGNGFENDGCKGAIRIGGESFPRHRRSPLLRFVNSRVRRL